MSNLLAYTNKKITPFIKPNEDFKCQINNTMTAVFVVAPTPIHSEG